MGNKLTLPVELTPDYKEWIRSLKVRVRSARLSAALKVNAEQIKLYYEIGCEVLDRLERAAWGEKILEAVSRDIREEFPGIEGFSVRNIKYMKVFAREWKGNRIGQRLVAQLPWGHNILLIDALSDMRRPMGVSTYELGLPPVEELQAGLNEALSLPNQGKI